MPVAEPSAGDHEPAAPPGRPVRTCIGCRSKAADTALLRVVAAVGAAGAARDPIAGDGDPGPVVTVVADPRRRMPGRGAWLHPDPACVELAVRRRAFGRALRKRGPIDPTPVGEYVARSEPAPATSGTTAPPARSSTRSTPAEPEPAGDDER